MLSYPGCHMRAIYIGCIVIHAHGCQVMSLLFESDIIMCCIVIHAHGCQVMSLLFESDIIMCCIVIHAHGCQVMSLLFGSDIIMWTCILAYSGINLEAYFEIKLKKNSDKIKKRKQW